MYGAFQKHLARELLEDVRRLAQELLNYETAAR